MLLIYLGIKSSCGPLAATQPRLDGL